jgi:hypothetical protein
MPFVQLLSTTHSIVFAGFAESSLQNASSQALLGTHSGLSNRRRPA